MESRKLWIQSEIFVESKFQNSFEQLSPLQMELAALRQLLPPHGRDPHGASMCSKLLGPFAAPIAARASLLPSFAWEAQKGLLQLTDRALADVSVLLDVVEMLASASHCPHSHRGLDEPGQGAAKVCGLAKLEQFCAWRSTSNTASSWRRSMRPPVVV